MDVIGPNVVLRDPHAGDADALVARLATVVPGSPPLRRAAWGPRFDTIDVAAWLDDRASARDEGRSLDFVVEHREHGVVGVAGITSLDRDDLRATIGTALSRIAYADGGHGESKALLAHVAFALCGLHRVTTFAPKDAEREAQSLLRLGFAREGVLRGWLLNAGISKDAEVYGMLRHEWEHSPLRSLRIVVDGDLPAVWSGKAVAVEMG